MRRGGWIAVVLAGLVGAAALVQYRPWQEETDPLAGLTWGEVTRGDLEVVVSSTGSLEAIDSVEVGTQVSGTLASVRVDFNDHVRAGQVLATIDPKLLDASLREAEAGLARTRAQLAQSEADLERQRALRAAGVTAESDFKSFETAVITAGASVESAEAQVARARENRANATIVAPIDGVVIERAVEQGQTVAASFNTPRLFLLAGDLARMRILAEVDEGDIGQIRVGQTARFTVAAYPELEFTGSVAQIRLQPKIEQNVVKYTVVVDAANEEKRLLPGMTATIDFQIETATDVLTVPAAATRVRPTAAMTAELEVRREEARAARAAARGEQAGVDDGGRPGDGSSRPGGGERRGRIGERGGGGRGGFRGGAGGGQRQLPPDMRRIYVRDENGRLTARPVRIGLTDGRRIEIRPLFGAIEPGTEVVLSAPDDDSRASPGGRGGPRGFRIL